MGLLDYYGLQGPSAADDPDLPPGPENPPQPGTGGAGTMMPGAVGTGFEFTPGGEPGGPGGGGGGGMDMSGLSNRPNMNFGPVPTFTPPEFQTPDFQAAMNDPGFAFRLRGGTDALERSAAARGVLRTGGTLKDIAEYGQNFAAQEYTNVFNRALQAYDRKYAGARDAFAPQMAQYQMRGQAEIQAALAAFNREWQKYTFGKNGGGGGGPMEPMPQPSDYGL